MNELRLVIDIGNTRVKYALFDAENTVHDSGSGWEGLELLSDKLKLHSTLIASVANEDLTKRAQSLFPTAHLYSTQLKLPLRNAYSTPESLGVDRIANAVAAHFLAKQHSALVVDAGTCLKVDFIDKHGTYQGGSISPGLHMRFRAMQAFTANLPLIENWHTRPLIGKTTSESLISGAVNGMEAEIFGTIQRYSIENKDLIVFLTGGDMHYFDLELKNPIFAVENLTLLGLKLILEVND